MSRPAVTSQESYKIQHPFQRDSMWSVLKRHCSRYSSSGIQALEWIPRVTATQRQGFEAVARFDGLTGFEFTERGADGSMIRAGPRPEYFPVYFVYPYANNQKALGFDLASNEARRRALVTSGDTGKTIISKRITLVQETQSQSGFLAFTPIYRQDMPHDTRETRSEIPRGFVLGVFRVSDLIVSALASLPAQSTLNIDITVLDQNAAEGQGLLFSSGPNKPGTTYPQAGDSGIRVPTISKIKQIGGRIWQIKFTELSGHANWETTWAPLSFLVIGLTVTGLVAFILFILINRNATTSRLVEVRSRELSDRVLDLEDAQGRLEQQSEELARERDRTKPTFSGTAEKGIKFHSILTRIHYRPFYLTLSIRLEQRWCQPP